MAIQYPINRETDRFTIFDTNTNLPAVDRNGKPLRGVLWGSTDVTQMITNLAPNIKWLQDIQQSQPAYDSATQRLERVTIFDVPNETALESWTVVDLTQSEINALAPAYFETADSPPIKLAVEEEDQNAFSRMNTLIDLSGMAGTDTVTIKDIDGNTYDITVNDFKATMVLYGQHCYTLFLQNS